MDAFHIRRSGPLSGQIRINGAKNSALKLVAAALLAPGRTVVRNVPAIADMTAMADVVAHLGVGVDRGAESTFVLDVPSELGTATPPELVKRLRASLVVLGPLLARQGRARVAQPGGCDLGSRNIDMHLSGLAAMGADIDIGPDYVEARAAQLSGARIELPFASVGATENIMLAAVYARGVTTIVNAAREPEIRDLAAFLRGMGATIRGDGTSDITIVGTDQLEPTTHEVVGDRIEAGTFAVAAAITGGDLVLDGVDPEHLRLALSKLAATGVLIDESDHGLEVSSDGNLRATDIVTLPFPGFPTDLQAQFLVLLSRAKGTSMVTENVFDGRFSVIAELSRMGADIDLAGHHALVRGATPLHGARVRATDLRAGAALVLAGLVAEGETIVTDPHHVDRGYADFAARLRSIGADVERATERVAA
jgi:UDP-N-acetylglucosamine 1-carboxyvinyltransferase